MLPATQQGNLASDRTPLRPTRSSRYESSPVSSLHVVVSVSSPSDDDNNSHGVIAAGAGDGAGDGGGGKILSTTGVGNTASSLLDFVPTLPLRNLSPVPTTRNKVNERCIIPLQKLQLISSPTTIGTEATTPSTPSSCDKNKSSQHNYASSTPPTNKSRGGGGDNCGRNNIGRYDASPSMLFSQNVDKNDMSFKVDLTPNLPTRIRSPNNNGKKEEQKQNSSFPAVAGAASSSFPTSPPLYLSTYERNDNTDHQDNKYGYETASPDIQERNEHQQQMEHCSIGLLLDRFQSSCRMQIVNNNNRCRRDRGEVHGRHIFQDDDFNSSLSSSSSTSADGVIEDSGDGGEKGGDYDRKSNRETRVRRSKSLVGSDLCCVTATPTETNNKMTPQLLNTDPKQPRRSSLKNSNDSSSQQRENFLRETFRRRHSSGTYSEDDFIEVSIGQGIPRKRRRSIVFSKEMEDVTVITPATDLAQCKSDLYLQHDDYKRIKQDIFQLTKQIKKLNKLKLHRRRLSDTAIDYTSLCTRGLEEVISRDMYRSSQLQYELATTTVFEKQHTMKYGNIINNNGDNEEDALARLYCQVTAISKREAMIRARKDELDILSIDTNRRNGHQQQQQMSQQRVWNPHLGEAYYFHGKTEAYGTNPPSTVESRTINGTGAQQRQCSTQSSERFPNMRMPRRGSCYV